MPAKKISVTLRNGRVDVLRRSVFVNGESKELLLFEPGQHYELKGAQVDAVQRDLAAGQLVETNLDDKGRQRDAPPSEPEPEVQQTTDSETATSE